MENLIERAVGDLLRSKYAIALTGAGISTESGIPDFRGPAGVWTKNPDAERRAYRGYERFQEDPKGWWEERLTTGSVLGSIEDARPNAGHLALAELEALGILRCLITQNVDGLHSKAGASRVIEYHGSLLKLRCTSCGARFPRDAFDLDGMLARGELPPRCPTCLGVVKTDGVSFGEPIPSDVAEQSLEEARKCDLMLICGTSAKVYPFADLPRVAKTAGGGRRGWARGTDEGEPSQKLVVVVEINAEPTPLTEEGISNYLIEGKTGEILPLIADGVRRRKR